MPFQDLMESRRGWFVAERCGAHRNDKRSLGLVFAGRPDLSTINQQGPSVDSMIRSGRVPSRADAIQRWAVRLARRVEAITLEHPEVVPDNIRLTLLALEWTPEQRLQRSLRRGRGFAAFRR